MAKVKKATSVASDKSLKEAPSIKTRSKSSLKDVPAESKTNLKEKPVKALAETLALDKNQQAKVSKETKKIKKGLKDGSIKLRSSRKELKQKVTEKKGLVYIGHLPHGFYEDEMRKFFEQFGKVTNVKVCRSRVSGNSKGYGYIEFQHPEVAKIAAESMNNYVMFKKRIVTEFVPHEKRPKGLFKGKSSNLENTSVKNRRGKQKHSRNKTQDEQIVAKKSKRGYKKLQTKLDKLKDLGIQCNLIPADVSNTIINEIKLEMGSAKSSSSGLIPKLPSLRLSKVMPSKISSKKSLTGIKSKKVMLTKSLDSVKTLLTKPSMNSQDEETQTPELKAPKKERVLRRGIVKVKKEKKSFTLNQDAVKKIARELIRKRGNPLISLTPSKPRGQAKNK